MNVTTSDLMAYAKECVAKNPELTSRELQAELETYYLQITNSFPDVASLLAKIPRIPVVGAIDNPADWFKGLGCILSAVGKMIEEKKIDGKSAAEVIQGIVIIVSRDGCSDKNK